MSIFLQADSRVLVQGLTGATASWVAEDMLHYGTQVVAGVVPGRGGGRHLDLPLFDLVEEAVAATGADTSLIMVPAAHGADAILEAIDAGIRLIVYPAEGLPVHDALLVKAALRATGVVMIGANTPGIISPGRAKVGFMPSACYAEGPVGVVSKSGSLSYEVSRQLTLAGLGQSTAVGIGGDPVKGLGYVDALRAFEQDPETAAVVLLGEVGGTDELAAARHLQHIGKPVVAYLVGRSAPPGRKLGHASAIVTRPASEGWDAKVAALRAAGARVAERPEEIPQMVREVMRR